MLTVLLKMDEVRILNPFTKQKVKITRV
jgi:hypothetical protein